MRDLILLGAAACLAMSGPAATAQQPERQKASVELSIVDAGGKRVEVSALRPADQQRVRSLRRSLEQWGNQQSQRVKITIACSYPPLRCTITIEF